MSRVPTKLKPWQGGPPIIPVISFLYFIISSFEKSWISIVVPTEFVWLKLKVSIASFHLSIANIVLNPLFQILDLILRPENKSIIFNFYSSLFILIVLNNSVAIHCANIGGTALPTCLYCWVLVPQNK